MLEHKPLVWAEIAVTDMNRAIEFYQKHMGLTFKQETIHDMEMAFVETKNSEDTNFALLKHEMMVPSTDGATVYLNIGPTLQPLVTKLEEANVPIILPAMPIKDGSCGYIAIFIDCEGNKVGLWSQNL